MKVAGWIFMAFGILNFIVFFIALCYNAVDAAVRNFSASVMLCVLGGFLIYRGNQKKKEKQEKEDWNR